MGNEQWAKDQIEKYNKENQSDIRRNDAIRDWDYSDIRELTFTVQRAGEDWFLLKQLNIYNI